ncbi:MAG: LLM class F420-dependent oxidoreductase [Gammaproteobacteria bacterium]|nr:LLM class F420-dependent oxidoreductase [Gammaproteobacteria bacterium]
MKLGLMLGYSGAHYKLPLDLVLEAERLGYDSVWTAEAYGSDAVTPVAWVLANTTRIKAGTAIMQLAGRTPATTAMTAMTLDHLSGGRFVLGVGPSGPQVVEGWHGELYGKPLTRQREYISIIRQLLAREKPVVHQGEHYHIPNTGPGATGLGKPLKSILHGNAGLPIYTGAVTENGVQLAAEVADGTFLVWMNPERPDIFAGALDKGFAKAGGGKSRKDFDLAPFVRIAMGDDIAACRRVIKDFLALYIGGMGARGKNFYNDYATRLGYADAAVKVQDLYLAGRKDEAIAAVPDQLVDECSLVGPESHIREQLKIWKRAAAAGNLGTMIVTATDAAALRVVAEEML